MGVGSGGDKAFADEPVVDVLNPYQQVDWATYVTYKGNFHTHTTESDGNQTPAAVIDGYHNQGYHVLALTDHDKVTYPWTAFDRDPSALGMIDVVGNELSGGHHIVSLFSDYTNPTADVSTRLTGVANAGGIAFFAHPRRYSYSAQWYAAHYAAHPHCFGQAIYNQGDRHSGHRELWDAVLSLTMPSRPVWGISEDDSHQASHIGRNRTYLLMPELSHANVRNSLVTGAFYATYSTSSSHEPPALTGVSVDAVAGTITVSGTGYTEVRWVSMGTQIATGETINLMNTPGVDRYVRAELYGPEGRTYTNPFGLTWLVNQPPRVSAGANRTVQISVGAILNGTATDDGQPDPPGALTLLWEKVSGEGTVTFANPSSAQTSADFSATGTYVLQLTAHDGERSASDEVTITVVAPPAEWTAFNDASPGSGQLTANITSFSLNQMGVMVDHATGEPVGVTVQIVNNPSAPAVSGGAGGPMPNAGTDAHATFHGKVSFSNVIYYGPQGWWVDAIFTGLDPSRRYEFATSCNRGRSDYGDRWSKFTISDIDEATEASTPGTTVFSPTSVAFSSGNNSTNGHVARWTEIRPGANGSFKVRVEAGEGAGMHPRNGYAFDGILLRDLGSAEPDLEPPAIHSLNPTNGATVVAVTTSLAITFDESVKKGAGDIVVRRMGGSAFATIGVASSNVSVSGAIVTISLPAALDPETQYYLEMDAGAIEDIAGNPFAGISGSATWSFTTDVPDTTPPAVISLSPEHGETSVDIVTPLIITFNEEVKKGSGNIVIHNADGAVVETIDVMASNVVVSGSSVTMIPSAPFEGGGTYHIEIDAGAILDLSNNAFEGISDSDTWSFTTEIPGAVLLYTGPAGAWNNDRWNTDANWTADPANPGGGSVPSGIIDVVIETNRAPYVVNATPAYTGSLTMEPGSFLGLGSNTANNPNRALGTETITMGNGSHIQMRYGANYTYHQPIVVNGSALIELSRSTNGRNQRTFNSPLSGGVLTFDGQRSNTATLRAANNLSHLIATNVQDTGAHWRVEVEHAEALGSGDVTIGGSVVLQISTAAEMATTSTLRLDGSKGNGTHKLILNQNLTVGKMFIGETEVSAGAYTSGSGLLDATGSALITGAGTLTVLGSASSGPELLTIEDDQDGGPVERSTEITYTLTFDSPMDLETFSISDFSNAGTAAISIASITEVSTEVFTVRTIPTSAGTLQFRVNQGAEIKDFEGNALDISTAILDVTIITITEPPASGSPFDDWADDFPGLTNPDPTLDFDGGGLAIALEWVLGGDPTDPSDDATIIPTLDTTSDPDGKLLFTFRRRAEAASDVNTTIIVEYGSDLAGWSAAAHEGTGTGDISISEEANGFADGIDRVTVALPPDLTANGKLFVRLSVDIHE